MASFAKAGRNRHHNRNIAASANLKPTAAVTSTSPSRTSASPHPPSETTSIYPSPSPSHASSPNSHKHGTGGVSDVDLPTDQGHKLSSASLCALEILRASSRGEYSGPSWVRFPGFSVQEYEDLRAAVDAAADLDFRHDYDSEVKLLVLRMPESPTHNAVKSQLGGLIQELVRRAISSVASTRPEHEILRRRIGYSSEGEITPAAARGLDGTKVPDISFNYAAAIYPTFVVEIGYSQKSKDLEYLARRYIGRSNGDIRTVLTIDLDYRDRKHRKASRPSSPRHHRVLRPASSSAAPTSAATTAADSTSPPPSSTLCLYRLGKRVMHNVVFRDHLGAGQPGDIPLTLADFVPDNAELQTSREVLEAVPIIVPFSELTSALAFGETRQAVQDTTPEPPQRGRNRVRFDWEPEGQVGSNAESSTETENQDSASASASALACRPPSKRRRLSGRSSDRQAGEAGGEGTTTVTHRPGTVMTRSRPRGATGAVPLTTSGS